MSDRTDEAGETSRRELLEEVNSPSTSGDETTQADVEDDRRGFLLGAAASALGIVGFTGSAGAKAPVEQAEANVASADELHEALESRQELVDHLADVGLLRESDVEELVRTHRADRNRGVITRTLETVGVGTDERAVTKVESLDDVEEEFVEFLHAGPRGTVRLEIGRKQGFVRIDTPSGVDDQELIASLNENVSIDQEGCQGDYSPPPCTCPNEVGCYNITSSYCDDICGSYVPGVPSACNSCDCVAMTCCDCDCNCAWSYGCDCQCDYPTGNCTNVPCCP